MAALSGIEPHAASFRDPAGFVFERDGEIYRAVHPDAVADIEALFSSGLHDALVADGSLVAHRRAMPSAAGLPEDWVLLHAERLPVISYPNEWTDAQLLAAAALTLELQRRALKHGLTLKDASAFNVQFKGAHAVFIDILSFTRLESSRAWPAYLQFCQHFLTPLALRRYIPESLTANIGLDGVPLAACSRMLPFRTWLRPALALHLHLHARAIVASKNTKRVGGDSTTGPETAAFRLRLVESLEAAISAVGAKQRDSHWTDYRGNNVYSADSAVSKRRFVEQAATRSGACRALDLGANDGHYARALANLGVACTAVEVDAACCERIYAASRSSPYDRLVNTVHVDLTNPTPAYGWANEERTSFTQRMCCDLTLSLALVHHLSITHQVPFARIARFLAQLAPHAVVEYIPLEDAMVKQLLAVRAGTTASYLETLSEASFRTAFEPFFECRDRDDPMEGGRVPYHFERRL